MLRRSRWFFLPLAGAFLVSLLPAVERGPRPEPIAGGESTETMFEKGLELHQDGVAGDEEAVREAQDIFEDLHARHPEDARILAFLGNLYTLRARDAVFFRKMDWLKKGLSTLDEAVGMRPEDPHVRSVRAINSYRLPGIFGRRDVASEDFGLLLDWTEEHPDRFDDGLLRFVYFHAGKFKADRNERHARELFELALSVPAKSVSDDAIREALADVRG